MMSKSILDYKSEMDSIKISDSFAKRTEKMMTEQPTIVINQRSAISWKKTTAIVGTAAACIAVLFVMNARRNNIDSVSDIAIETIVCVTELSENAEPTELFATIINEDAVVDDIDLDMIVELNDDMAAFGDISTEPNGNALVGDSGVKTTTTAKTEKTETKNTTPPKIDEKSTAKQSDAPTSAGGLLAINPLAAETDAQAAFDATVAMNESTNEMFPFFIDDIDYNTSKIEIISYINDNTKSIDMSYTNDDAQQTAYNIKNIIFNAKTTDYAASRVLFYITISKDAQAKYFEMYLTENKHFIMICNYPDGQQRVSYQLNDSEYAKMEQLLYLKFGTQSEYEEYSALKSGK